MKQRNLVLILARDLADKLASAVFIVDEEGALVYFNEAAGEILGKSFAEVGTMSMDEWATAFWPRDPDGVELPPEDVPLAVALKEHRPSHREMQIEGMDGEVRAISVTALPLFARSDEFVGACAIFWEDSATRARAQGAQG
ncbi:MAG: PAS domain-containing protein [Actinomycetota bacterium]|nr:PAS domain-containing protein [Actinomycetota bacterium]